MQEQDQKQVSQLETDLYLAYNSTNSAKESLSFLAGLYTSKDPGAAALFSELSKKS